MEQKTNKAKLEIFKFLTIQLYRKAIAFDRIVGNYALSANSTKNKLIRVFMHAEFISAIKTVQNPMVFVKKANQ